LNQIINYGIFHTDKEIYGNMEKEEIYMDVDGKKILVNQLNLHYKRFHIELVGMKQHLYKIRQL
jgi:hypothetical protein